MPDAAAYPPPLTRQPSWLPLVGGGGAAPTPTSGFPGGEGWPAIESLDYAIKLITLLVLVLALPWILGRFVHDGHLSRHAASVAPINPVD